MRNLTLFVLITLFLGACGPFTGNLRRDLDDAEPYDAPTIGGRWTERSLLNEGESGYSVIGHNERAPASEMYQGAAGRGSWISPDQLDANRRDRYRDMRTQFDEKGEAISSGSTRVIDPPIKRLYKGGSNRATRADFIDDVQDAGSLWASDGQTNYYFTKNKIRGVGDIVNVAIEDEMLKDLSMELTRSLSPREKEIEIEMAQMRLNAPPESKTDKPAAATPPKPGEKPAEAKTAEAAPKEPKRATIGDVDLSQSMGVKSGDTIMTEIIGRYPNGNYRVRGIKKLRYNNTPRIVSVTAIAKSSDISEEDQVSSGKLYEYKLQAVR